MTRDNEKFGVGVQGQKPIEGISIPISLMHTGLNLDVGPMDVDDTEALDISGIRITRGGIAPEYAMVMFPDVDVMSSASPILHIVSFGQAVGKKVVRMRYDRWQWFNGAIWIDVPGVVSGLQRQRLYTTTLDDKLIAANGFARLQVWNGNPISPVGDLSAEAPAAFYATRIGNRIFVAKVRFDLGLDFDPNGIAWSADNDILEWTDVSLGAGNLPLKPEGLSSAQNPISGLSNIERGVLIYRERSLVLASRTGVRAAPFRFSTIDFAHGTESPYAIVNAGLTLGDVFLGYDYVVYYFDGQNPPVPIGLPIQSRLESRITNLAECVAFINPVTMEYHLLSPTTEAEAPVLKDDHIFSIRDYVKYQKLKWRYRPLDTGLITTGAYAPAIATSVNPFVDTLNVIPDDRVDPTSPAEHVLGIPLPTDVAAPLGRPFTVVDSLTGGYGSALATMLPPGTWIDVGTNPTNVITALTNAKNRGFKVVLKLPTSAHGPYLSVINGSSRFDIAKWKAEANKFNRADVIAAIAQAFIDGTLLFISVMDEPPHSDWGPDGWMTKPVVDSLCAYLRTFLLTVPMGVACSWLWRVNGSEGVNEHYEVLEVLVPQTWETPTSTWTGGPDVYAAGAKAIEDAERAVSADGKAHVTFHSINLAAGPKLAGCIPRPGGTTCAMLPSEIKQWGIALGVAGVGLNMWRYFPEFWADPAKVAAFQAIKDRLDIEPFKQLRRT